MPPEPSGEKEPQPPGFPALDDTVYDATDDPLFNGFMSMYRMLPEWKMTRCIGANVLVDVEGNGQNPHVELVAALGKTVVGVDKTVPKSEREYTPYVYLHGSVLVSAAHAPSMTEEEIKQEMAHAVNKAAGVGRKLETGLILVYLEGLFCRDASLAYSRAYPVEALRTPELLERARLEPLSGNLVTVPIDKRPQILFVEANVDFTPPMRNVYEKLGGITSTLLDFVAPD